MEKAVFLDRDGTINVEKNYLYKIDDFEFLPNVFDGLELLQKAGFRLFIVTNQSGIGRGYYEEEDFWKLTDWMLGELSLHGIEITKVYYCPHLPDAQRIQYRKICKCRKPATGMYWQAVKEFNVNLKFSYTIGDKIRDSSISMETGCRGYLIGHSEDTDVITKVKMHKYANIVYKKDLYESALDIIEREGIR